MDNKKATWCDECQDHFTSEGDIVSISRTGKCTYCAAESKGNTVLGICKECKQPAGYNRILCRRCEGIRN